MVKMKILVLFLIIVSIFSCRGKPPSPILHPPPVPEEKRLSVDYVFLIDNSGSIPPGEARSFAREAIKAFIELAEEGDRISIITFDKEAEVIASETITGQIVKERLQNNVETKLTFKGTHTDISKGVEFLKEKKSILFRGSGVAKPAVILISDGKLEPKGDLQRSYQKLIQDFESLSETMPFYTLGLGEKEIEDEFLSGVSGEKLLTRMAVDSGGRFYRVRSVNDLVETCVGLLRFIKGYGELTEKQVFWTDESTLRLALLVIKRLPERQICRTGDIRVKDPGKREVSFDEASNYQKEKTRIIWRQGTYYDLILIEKPHIGEWTVNHLSGEPPRVVALIRNQVHLRYLVQREYWDQERKVAMAWLYDERKSVLSERPCQIDLKFDIPKDFKETQNKIRFEKTKEATFLNSLLLKGKEPASGKYLMEIMAEDKASFFSRRSPLVSVNVKEAYFNFIQPDGTIQKWPIFWKGLKFGAMLDSGHPNFPQFRDLPKISLHIEKIEEKRRDPLPKMEIPYEKSGKKIIYQLRKPDMKLGEYGGYYVLEGRLVSGKEVRHLSPLFYFSLKWPFWVWVIGVVILLFLFYFILYSFRPKLYGRLEFSKPQGRPPILLTKHKKVKKSIRGDTLRLGSGGGELTELMQTSFILTGVRGKGLKIKLEKGNLSLTKDGQTRPLTSSELYRGDILTVSDQGRDYVVEINSPRRPPRQRGR